MNAKSTKRAWLMSMLSVLLCLTMLIGSTFAWFTDQTSANVNTIKSGNLEVELQMLTDAGWVDAEGETLNFKKAQKNFDDEEILWEPGATYELPALKIVNKGNLALQFQMFVNGLAGDMKLAEVLDVMIKVDDAEPYNAGTLKALMADIDGAAHGVLYPETSGQAFETGAYTIALHMQETANNDYENLTISNMSFTIVANQYTYEYDSNDNLYDEDAVVDASALTGEAAKELAGNIAVQNLSMDLTNAAPDTAIGDANLKASNITELAFNGGVINTAYMANPNPADTDWPKTYTANGSKITLNVPANTKVVFRNVTFNGFYSFVTTSSGLAVAFENCTINGCWASQTTGLKDISFKNCRFTLDGIATESIKNTNPLWLAPDKVQTLTLDGCTIEGNRPIKYAGDQNDPYTTDVTLNVTNCVFKLAPTAYDTNANRLDRLTAIRFDDDIKTVNATGNTMIGGYAFYQTNNAPFAGEGYTDANNTKPADALWRVEY